jgi:hypothetical protein
MIYFITEAWLKANTPITANVDVTDVIPWVQTAADLEIKPILGTYFYDIILAKYNAQTLNADEITLVSIIKPAIAWRAAGLSVYGLTYQLKNKGLQKQSGDNSESVDLEETKFGMSHYEQMSRFYSNQLIKWLKANKDLFPDFTNVLNNDSNYKDRDNTFDTIILI